MTANPPLCASTLPPSQPARTSCLPPILYYIVIRSPATYNEALLSSGKPLRLSVVRKVFHEVRQSLHDTFPPILQLFCYFCFVFVFVCMCAVCIVCFYFIFLVLHCSVCPTVGKKMEKYKKEKKMERKNIQFSG
eukprot:Rmarinus@m.19096